MPTRRQLLATGFATGAAMGLSGGLTGPATARMQTGRAETPQGSGRTLIRSAYVMTMGSQGDRPDTDVLVENGAIGAIGNDLEAEGAEIIDASGQILLPGFVDTHTHIWLSQMRGLFSRSEETKYFPLVERLGAAYTADDMRIGTLYGAAGNLFAGITTTFPYCDNIRTPADAEAALSALAEAGIRARFLYTGNDALASDAFIDRDHFRALHDTWAEWSHDGLIGLGLGWRAPRGDAPAAIRQRAAAELAMVREMGLPVSSHVSGANGPAVLSAMIEDGALGPDMLLVHATNASQDQLAAVREAGAAVVLTPTTEQRVGFGITRLSDYAALGDQISLGIDGGLAGAPDMVAQMKMLHNVEAGASGKELAVLPRRLIRMATIDGARAVGLGDAIGSIEPGKRADLQLIDPRSVTMGPLNDDPSALIVYSARPHNTRLVMVDGRIVKRDGRLTQIDEAALSAEAARSIARIRQAA